jgi:hypothetical protein
MFDWREHDDHHTPLYWETVDVLNYDPEIRA